MARERWVTQPLAIVEELFGEERREGGRVGKGGVTARLGAGVCRAFAEQSDGAAGGLCGVPEFFAAKLSGSEGRAQVCCRP